MKCPKCGGELVMTEDGGLWCDNGCYKSEFELWKEVNGEPKLLYIIGPYRNEKMIGVKRNIRKAERAMEWAWENGWTPVCPHTNSAFVDGITYDAAILSGYKKLMLRCDAVMLIDGWKTSKGSVEELKLAEENGIDVLPFMFNG